MTRAIPVCWTGTSNPGHTLEDAWFLLEFLEEYGELDKYLPRIAQIAKRTFHLGWDEKYGGLLRFVDREGGAPRGDCIGTPYEELVKDTWDMKLWWPHSELLYIFSYLYQLTGDEEFEALYQQSADYAFSTFPNISWEGHCMYCGHCAPCPRSIDVAMVNKFLNLAKAQGTVPETVREHYEVLAHHAGECIACGACEKRCPFGVPVIQSMQEAKVLFGK